MDDLTVGGLLESLLNPYRSKVLLMPTSIAWPKPTLTLDAYWIWFGW